jgi:hypothetical protein
MFEGKNVPEIIHMLVFSAIIGMTALICLGFVLWAIQELTGWGEKRS